MSVNGVLIGEFTALFTGIDTRYLTMREAQRLVGVSARNLQKRVATSFARQKIAGNSALLPNTPKWNEYKAKNGLDPRRGHATNTLQGVLDSLTRLYAINITPQGQNLLAARVTMEEGMLHSLVEYAKYYEEAKVSRGGILALAASWVREEAMKINAKQEAARLKAVKFSQRVIRDRGIVAQRQKALAIIDSITAPRGAGGRR